MYILGLLMHTYINVIKISNQKYTIANIKCCIDYRVHCITHTYTLPINIRSALSQGKCCRKKY